MTSLSYGRIFCLEFQIIDGTYQRYNHYFEFFLLEFYFFFYLKFDFSLLEIEISFMSITFLDILQKIISFVFVLQGT